MIGIYKITSPSGRIYIGQSVNLGKRKSEYERMVSSTKGQTKLYRSLVKYSFSEHVFEVVEECDEDQLNIRERHWQDFYDVLSKGGLNCRLTGTEDRSGKLSEETKCKISESHKGKVISRDRIEALRMINLGCKRTQESILRGLETKGVFRHTEESKRKMSEQKKKKGSMHTEESKKKISEARKGIKFSEERCRSISERQLGKKRGPYKKK